MVAGRCTASLRRWEEVGFPSLRRTDPLHGISFRYPKSYILKTGDEPSFDLVGMGVQTDFVQPGGMTVAAIESPLSSYPGTDFTSSDGASSRGST